MTRPFWIYTVALSRALLKSIKAELPGEMERMRQMRRDVAGDVRLGSFEAALVFDEGFEMGYLASFCRSEAEAPCSREEQSR